VDFNRRKVSIAGFHQDGKLLPIKSLVKKLPEYQEVIITSF